MITTGELAIDSAELHDVYFLNTAVGSTSAAQNMTLTNNQNATSVSISSIATSGDFAQTNNCGTSLAPLSNSPRRRWA